MRLELWQSRFGVGLQLWIETAISFALVGDQRVFMVVHDRFQKAVGERLAFRLVQASHGTHMNIIQRIRSDSAGLVRDRCEFLEIGAMLLFKHPGEALYLRRRCIELSHTRDADCCEIRLTGKLNEIFVIGTELVGIGLPAERGNNHERSQQAVRHESANHSPSSISSCADTAGAVPAFDDQKTGTAIGTVKRDMDDDDLKQVRRQLGSAISGGESHITFEKVVKDFPVESRGVKPQGAPHTAWELVEHMRIAQRDILEFSHDARHQSPEFPEGYWPQTAAPPDAKAWDASVAAFLRDEQELKSLVHKADLFTPFEHGEGQNLLREALLVANHNSYELGQLVFLKRMLTGKA
jgi:hypothetical protein